MPLLGNKKRKSETSKAQREGKRRIQVNEIASIVNKIAANLNFSTNSKIAISKDDHQFIIRGTVESSADEHFLLISQLYFFHRGERTTNY